jgi:hypothetical protein
LIPGWLGIFLLLEGYSFSLQLSAEFLDSGVYSS